MTANRTEVEATTALKLIHSAFSNRAQPGVVTDSKQLTDLEYEEVMSFNEMLWQDVNYAQVEEYPDAVFWFSPEAFCYYLPGILAAGLKEGRWDSNAYDSLIGCLDRGPKPDYWDDFFLPRWPLLTAEEIDAVAAWARWLETVQPDAYHDNTYERVHDTLTLLKERARKAETRN